MIYLILFYGDIHIFSSAWLFLSCAIHISHVLCSLLTDNSSFLLMSIIKIYAAKGKTHPQDCRNLRWGSTDTNVQPSGVLGNTVLPYWLKVLRGSGTVRPAFPSSDFSPLYCWRPLGPDVPTWQCLHQESSTCAFPFSFSPDCNVTQRQCQGCCYHQKAFLCHGAETCSSQPQQVVDCCVKKKLSFPQQQADPHGHIYLTVLSGQYCLQPKHLLLQVIGMMFFHGP